jgi:hypothetical protein
MTTKTCSHGYEWCALCEFPSKRIADLEYALATATGLLDRVKPATLDRNFHSNSISSLCQDIELFKKLQEVLVKNS